MEIKPIETKYKNQRIRAYDKNGNVTLTVDTDLGSTEIAQIILFRISKIKSVEAAEDIIKVIDHGAFENEIKYGRSV